MDDDLQLKLALSSSLSDQYPHSAAKRKRFFGEAFSDVVSSKRTLPLLTWDDEDGGFEEEKRIHKPVLTNRFDELEADLLVGWPPVKSCTKKFYEQNRRRCTAANYITVENGGGGGGGGGSKSMYVKVEMEGIGIGRKVDLSIHHTYESLTATLVAMFGKCQENVEMYNLAYRDKEGDWLLAGDVPWGRFVESVRRLKLVKNEH